MSLLDKFAQTSPTLLWGDYTLNSFNWSGYNRCSGKSYFYQQYTNRALREVRKRNDVVHYLDIDDIPTVEDILKKLIEKQAEIDLAASEEPDERKE